MVSEIDIVHMVFPWRELIPIGFTKLTVSLCRLWAISLDPGLSL